MVGYLFVLPAALATFAFGLWPVVAGFYESLKSGSPITNRYVGLYNYVRSLGSLIYILLLLLALIFIYVGYRSWRKATIYRATHGGNLWYYLGPGLLVGLGVVTLVFNFVTGYDGLGWLPVVLFILALGGFYTADQLQVSREEWDFRDQGLLWLNLLAIAGMWVLMAWQLDNPVLQLIAWTLLAALIAGALYVVLSVLRRKIPQYGVLGAALGIYLLVLVLIGPINGLLFTVLIQLIYLALPRLSRIQTGTYIGMGITVGVMLLSSILLLRYGYSQMAGDMEGAQKISKMLFNQQVLNATVNVSDENGMIGGLTMDGEIIVKVKVNGKTIEAPLAADAYSTLPIDRIANLQAAFANRQRVQVLLPDGSMAEGELVEAAEASFITEEATAQSAVPIYSALDVGESVILTKGFTEPLWKQIAAAIGVFLGITTIYTMGWVRKRIDSDEHDRIRRWLFWGRLFLGVAAFFLLFYLLGSVQLNRQASAGMKALSLEQFQRAYTYVTGQPPNPTLRPQDLAAELVYWPQVFLIASGALLIGIAYLVWQSAQKRESKLSFSLTLLLAILMMVGGWLMISELPRTVSLGGRESRETFDSLVRTAMYSFFTVPVQLALGLALAYLLFSEVGWGKGIYRVIYFMPYIAPSVATSTVFLVIFSNNPTSLANRTLGLLGIDPLLWLQEPKGIVRVFYEKVLGGEALHIPSALQGPSLALFTVILYNIWVFAGYNSVVFLAGLGAIPGELYEAAEVDGAGRWARFRNITLPLLSPTTFFLSMLSIIGTFKAFTHIYVLRRTAVGKELDTMSVHIFENLYSANDPGYAAALAFTLFGVILILTLVQNRLTREQVFYG